MRESLLVLALLFGQAQLPIVQTIDMPKGYEAWAPTTSVKEVKNGVIAEKQIWVDETKGTDPQAVEIFQVLMVCKVNSEVYKSMYMRVTADQAKDQPDVYIEGYWLVREGYVRLDSRNGVTDELKNSIDEAWKKWEEYVKSRFNVTSEEANELADFCIPVK